ncbi:integrase, catalytic region, zinc finger, CCHC-type containing protein [Tanacetum coccineum]
MEAGGKDRPPMLAPGNYVQWKSRIKRYIDTKPNNELIHYCLQNPPYKFKWTEKTVPVAEGSSETTIEGYMENYKNVSQDIHDQLNAEAEVVQIILTGIDNDIYSTVDACQNACEIWKAIERLKQGESINVQDLETNLYWEFRKFTSRDGESLESYYSRFYKMMNELVRNQCDVTNHQVNVQFLLQLQPEWQRFVTLVKQSQELKTVSYHKLYDILKQHQNEVNEIRAERLARTANPLALVAQQQPVYHPQNHPNHYTQNSSTRSQQVATRNRGKAIVTSSAPTYDPEPATVTEDEEMSKEKEIDKLMALISLSFKKIYKPTNNNLRTSSNTSRANQDNTPRINREIGHVARECHKLNGQRMQFITRRKCYCIQEVTPDDADNSRPIFDAEPLQKVQNNDDNYNVFAIESEHPEQPESVNDTYPVEQDEHNIIIDSLDMSYDREQDDQDDNDDLAKERDLLASLIAKLKCEIDDSKNRNKFLETSNKALVDKLKARRDNSIHRRLWVLKAHDGKSQASKSGSRKYQYQEGLLCLNHNLFSVGQFCDADLEVAFRKSTCYIRDLKGNDLLTASSSQAWLWHRRLSHLNFDTINLLLKYDIVTGLPKLKFVKDHLCSSCELGKAKHKSFKTKTTPSSKRRLQVLHMDLCGPMRVESFNGKKYVLVIVDDYSRYTWTHFLRSKDETPEVLIDFLKLVQRGLHAQVRTV